MVNSNLSVEDAFAGAPEFLAFRQKQQRLAQARARGQGRSVYRLSTVLDNKHGEPNDNGRHEYNQHQQRRRLQEGDDHATETYESYEVVQDFVGSRTVGGFALQDDEDDAFDDNHSKQLTKVSNKNKPQK